jgi:RNAse (barnase) inhibitor barstar
MKYPTPSARPTSAATDGWQPHSANPSTESTLSHFAQVHAAVTQVKERSAEMDTPLRKIQDTPLRGVRANIVQSIRAFRLQDLQQAAQDLGCHFLYANLAHAQTKADILELLSTQFFFPAHFGKNFDALYDCLTDPIHKAGPQPGFVVVLDQIPTTPKFDKEVREQLLDSFRDAAEYWAERKIAFRCFYSFL